MIIALLGESATGSRKSGMEVDGIPKICYYGVLQMETAVTKPELSDRSPYAYPSTSLRKSRLSGPRQSGREVAVIVRALRYYLSGEGSEILAAIEGRRQIAEGKSHDMDDVIAELDAIAEGRAVMMISRLPPRGGSERDRL